LAKPKSEERIFDSGDKVTVGDYQIKEKWADEYMRNCTVDCQEKEYWVEIRAWSKNGSSRQLYYGSVTSEAEIQGLVSEFSVQPKLVFLDIGFDQSRILSMCARHGWTGIKGSGQHDFFTHVKSGQKYLKLFDRPKTEMTSERIWVTWFLIASNRVRDIFALLRDGKIPGVEFLSLDSAEYHKQAYSEIKKKVIDKKTGRTKWIWVKLRANHGFDTSCYSIASFLMYPGTCFPQGTVPDTDDDLVV
jgi:hypothetical protein